METSSRILALSLIVVPSLALAHPGHDETATFFAGFMHPLLGIDHLLAALAVGLLAGRCQGAWRWAMPAMFVAAMLLAFVFARAIPPMAMAELLVAVSLIALGVFALMERRAPALLLIAVGFFGGVHGFVHGGEVPGDGSGIAYAVGLGVATAIAHGAGVFAGARVERGIQLAIKLIAGLICMFGVALLGILVVS
ncbi:MAG: HupE/UreJ family protein [Betaproteobacteria bacterium]|nr:HupE/UreJ family protein [Betaproteobacteria bacterium]